MTDETPPYVPKPGDEVDITYESWAGRKAQLRCIWVSVQPVPKEEEPTWTQR
jgi:hypothetical protein